MAENNAEPEPDWNDRALDMTEDTLVAMETLLATLRAFEDVLRQQEISVASSTEYCDNFCQALMHYAGSRNSVEHGLPLLEVYCLSINCFAAARSHLTSESDRVALVLKRLALSCFELLLSVPEDEIPFEAWVQFHQSVQIAHDNLLQYGSTDLQALLQITGEGGAWSNPVLTGLLTGQPTDAEEVNDYISLEGEGFMEMRVKHLEKIGEVAKAVVLAKACTECSCISNQPTFRQTYVSLLCHLLPNEEAIMEISRLDCKDVLEITCNLENEGEENTAFILCTTFLTQQLQQQSLYCSWDLTLLWSKLQRRIDPSLESLLERCLQLGAIAKTVYHLLYLVQVIQTEAEDLGLASSVELCVKALQLPKQDDLDTRISVCKTVSCLLPNDLEVLRACQLTEFLLGPSQEVFGCLEDLYLRPDQKYDQENGVIPNSLRCELLLALKAYWPFDPEFWDWKTLKYHCISLLGLMPESEGEEEEVVDGQERSKHKPQEQKEEAVESEHQNGLNGSLDRYEQVDKKHLSQVQGESHTKKHKFCCQICKRSVSETQIVHHSKRHAEENTHPCPVCLERFKSRKELVPHMKQHVHNEAQAYKNNEKKKDVQKETDEDDDIEPGEITIDPSLMLYYKSTHDPDVFDHIVQQAKSGEVKRVDDDEHITFDYIDHHFNLQNRDEYPCPGTGCAKTFKHSKYLYVHLKSEHKGDENVKHFHEMRDKREKCVFCRRHFVSAYHHRKHRKAHYGDRPYTCVVLGCGAQFSCSNELVAHKQTHGYQLSYQCELKGCYVTYSDLGQMYHHEAQHFRDAAFTCSSPDCKKFYLSKHEFTQHLFTHNITFSEKDFEAERKAKLKLLKIDSEETAKSGDIKTASEEIVNGDDLVSSSVSCPSLQSPGCKEPKGTLTLVAVCFDGSKFTCGFEKCGMTFSRARDVQRHLKCTHPEHLKLENKEYKHDKERGFNSKGLKIKTEPNSEDKGKNEPASSPPIKEAVKEIKEPPHLKNSETNSSSLEKNDALREILIGLGKLDLNSQSFQSEPSEPLQSTSEPQTSLMSLHQAILAKPPVVVLQKRPPHLTAETVKVKSEHILRTGEQGSGESLANAKPYTCGIKSCGFRTAQSYSLLRHYTTKHGRTMEQAKRLTSLKTTSFKPYMCQLCSKSHRQKNVLKAHYIQGPQKDDPGSPTTRPVDPESDMAAQSEEMDKEAPEENKEVSDREEKKNPYDSLVYRSHEEALQMCQDRCLRVGYPCMVQDCDSVVRYMKSMQRHYIKVHRIRQEDFAKHEDKLVFNAEQLEEIIQRKSARPTVAGPCTPNGVHKMEYQAEQENPGGQSTPMSLHSIKAHMQDDSHDPLAFPEEEEEEEVVPPVERNGVLLGADEVLYGELSTGGHTEEQPSATQSSHSQEEKLSLQNIKALLRPVTVDLTTPSSLRFTIEESIQGMSSSKDGGKMLNGSLPTPPIRQPLKRKNEMSEQPSNLKDTGPSPCSFDIATYKPMGFESSFLQFIQDTNPTDKEIMLAKRRDSFRHSCSVKENNQLGISHTRSRRTHSPLLKPLAMTGDLTAVQNLKSILDKALAGCGDLAIKQLQYLRPVVVLGRPVCTTTLPDLFPSDTNNGNRLLET
ncbi:hypothetical protein LDENG_00280270 [Lucifuga dentata]|nr:hypothetical protein LDENG_00280270 [Lucifuga dentata]